MKLHHVVFSIFACCVSSVSVGMLGYEAAREGIVGFLLAGILTYTVNFFSFQLIVSAGLMQLQV